jgi:hypothetical protein
VNSSRNTRSMKSAPPLSGRSYKYTVIFRDGTWYQGDVPYPEETAWDKPLTHLFLSYKMSATKVARAYIALIRR